MPDSETYADKTEHAVETIHTALSAFYRTHKKRRLTRQTFSVSLALDIPKPDEKKRWSLARGDIVFTNRNSLYERHIFRNNAFHPLKVHIGLTHFLEQLHSNHLLRLMQLLLMISGLLKKVALEKT